MLKRINAFLSIKDGCFTRTRNFYPDHLYSSFHLDTELFDELTFIDISGGEDRVQFVAYLKKILKNSFLPVSVGGGIRNLEDCELFFDLGVDRIVINTILWNNPKLVEKISLRYGSQAIVASVDIIKAEGSHYSAYDWKSKKAYKDFFPEIIINEKNLIGEIMIQSYDRDGTILGFDHEITDKINEKEVNDIPLNIASGFAKWEHYYEVLKKPTIDCVSVQNVHHLSAVSIDSLKRYCKSKGISLRE